MALIGQEFVMLVEVGHNYCQQHNGIREAWNGLYKKMCSLTFPFVQASSGPLLCLWWMTSHPQSNYWNGQ